MSESTKYRCTGCGETFIVFSQLRKVELLGIHSTHVSTASGNQVLEEVPRGEQR